jgi:hypothetical protein
VSASASMLPERRRTMQIAAAGKGEIVSDEHEGRAPVAL